MFLVHRVPNGIAVKPLLKYWRTWSCLERITEHISVRGARSEPQHGSNDTYDPTVKKVKLVLLAFILLQETIMEYLTKY